MEINKNIFHPLRAKYQGIDLSILSYVSLVNAITKYQNSTTDIDKNAIELRSKSIQKFPKREKLLGRWALIKELKNEKGLSFRQIADYLKKYHKLNVVHSTIYELWNELEITPIGEK